MRNSCSLFKNSEIFRKKFTKTHDCGFQEIIEKHKAFQIISSSYSDVMLYLFTCESIRGRRFWLKCGCSWCLGLLLWFRAKLLGFRCDLCRDNSSVSFGTSLGDRERGKERQTVLKAGHKSLNFTNHCINTPNMS